jgi:hypothetical protein
MSTSNRTSSTTDRKIERPGDAQGVAVPHTDAAPGTSEEFPVKEGVHTFPATAQEQGEDQVPAAGDHRDLSK